MIGVSVGFGAGFLTTFLWAAFFVGFLDLATYPPGTDAAGNARRGDSKSGRLGNQGIAVERIHGLYIYGVLSYCKQLIWVFCHNDRIFWSKWQKWRTGSIEFNRGELSRGFKNTNRHHRHEKGDHHPN